MNPCPFQVISVQGSCSTTAVSLQPYHLLASKQPLSPHCAQHTSPRELGHEQNSKGPSSLFAFCPSRTSLGAHRPHSGHSGGESTGFGRASFKQSCWNLPFLTRMFVHTEHRPYPDPQRSEYIGSETCTVAPPENLSEPYSPLTAFGRGNHQTQGMCPPLARLWAPCPPGQPWVSCVPPFATRGHGASVREEVAASAGTLSRPSQDAGKGSAASRPGPLLCDTQTH